MEENKYLNQSCFSNYRESFTYEHGSTPYVVRISGDRYIPLNCIVFADNKQHAISIVVEGLNWQNNTEVGLPNEILSGISAGKLKIEAELYQKNIVSRVQWSYGEVI